MSDAPARVPDDIVAMIAATPDTGRPFAPGMTVRTVAELYAQSEIDLARDLRATADALKRIGLDAQFASTTLRHVAEAVDAAADRPVPGTGTDEPDSSQDAR